MSVRGRGLRSCSRRLRVSSQTLLFLFVTFIALKRRRDLFTSLEGEGFGVVPDGPGSLTALLAFLLLFIVIVIAYIIALKTATDMVRCILIIWSHIISTMRPYYQYT